MLTDFANGKLQAKIAVNTLSADGYEADNLLQNKNSRQTFFHRKYFMSEYYVKCPVKLLLTFPCLIDISAVVINPKASTHRSRCIELHAAFQRPMKTSKAGTSPGNLSANYQFDLSDFQQQSSLLNQIGKYNERSINGGDVASKIVFHNERHGIQYKCNDAHFKIPLKPLACISACSNLLINITWATIPVINELEVWGCPSQRNPVFLKEAIRLLLDTQRLKVDTKPDMKTSMSKPVEKPIETEHKHLEDEIPPEFVDPITLSIMTIPLLLPSGNNIDKTTLEKFISVEHSYGRLPSDPFTGVVLHGSRQPIPNTSLKLRIDEYILKNKIDDVPKTYLLGSGSTSSSRQNKPSSTHSGHSNIIKSCETKNVEHAQTIEPSFKKKKVAASHQLDLDESLDAAISQTLFSLPDCFTKKQEPQTKCFRCSKGDKRELYKLPCRHQLCRSCLHLVMKGDRSCTTCLKPFKHQDVTKVIL